MPRFFLLFILIVTGVGVVVPADGVSAGNPFQKEASLLETGLVDVEVVDTYAYGVLWDKLVIFDVSIPDAPTLVSQLDLEGSLRAIEISGAYAYIAAEFKGVHVVDISKPNSPVKIATLLSPWQELGGIRDISISGDHAVLAKESKGIVVVNISNPLKPVTMGTLDIQADEKVRRVHLVGQRVFIADETRGFRIVDISNPSVPKEEVYATALPHWMAMDVYAQGNFAYVAVKEKGLVIYDVSHVAAPVLLSQVPLAQYSWAVTVQGDYAYVLDREQGMFIVNVSNPSLPTVEGSYNSPDWDYEIFVLADRAYIAGGWTTSFVIVNTADVRSPYLAGKYEFNGEVLALSVSGNYAYQAVEKSGLYVIDISDATAPRILGSLASKGSGLDIELVGDLAYIADGYKGLRIVDVSTPSNPTELSYLDLAIPGAEAYSVKVMGSYAYMACGYGGVAIADISDPRNPVLAGTVDTPGFAVSLALNGSHAYVADQKGGLQIIDVSDPQAPRSEGSYATLSEAWDILISGNTLYLSDSYAGVAILDISNPIAPVPMGHTPPFSYRARALALDGPYLYIGNMASGFFIYDVTLPSRPKLVRWVQTSGYPWIPGAIVIADPYVYVADFASFSILRYTGPTLVNDGPTADAGGSRNVDEGSPIVLNGSGSFDPNGDAITYSWVQTSGPAVTLSDAAAVQPVFTAPFVPVDTALTFQLTVSDGTLEGTDTATITILNSVDDAPTASAGGDQAVDEGEAATLDGSGSIDPNGDALSFSWVQTSGPSVILSGADTATPGFTSPRVYGPEVLTFRLTVSDGTLSATDMVEVTVRHSMVEPPPGELAASNIDGVLGDPEISVISGSRIDGYDLMVLLRVLGDGSVDPAWREAADINRDGAVDETDLGILMSHFGESL